MNVIAISKLPLLTAPERNSISRLYITYMNQQIDLARCMQLTTIS